MSASSEVRRNRYSYIYWQACLPGDDTVDRATALATARRDCASERRYVTTAHTTINYTTVYYYYNTITYYYTAVNTITHYYTTIAYSYGHYY